MSVDFIDCLKSKLLLPTVEWDFAKLYKETRRRGRWKGTEKETERDREERQERERQRETEKKKRVTEKDREKEKNVGMYEVYILSHTSISLAGY